MGRAPCSDKAGGLKRGTWTAEEDKKLKTYIEQHGHGSWKDLSQKAGLNRCGKSCRLRWINYLRPDIKRGKFSLNEDQTIIQLHALLGNRWSAIASYLPKRTDNDVKNYWNTHLKKRLTKMGIDPSTHKPKTTSFMTLSPSQQKHTDNLSHMAQWERARLEAEARLSWESKMLSPAFPPPPLPPPPCQLDVQQLQAWEAAWTTNNRVEYYTDPIDDDLSPFMRDQNDNIGESNPTTTGNHLRLEDLDGTVWINNIIHGSATFNSTSDFPEIFD